MGVFPCALVTAAITGGSAGYYFEVFILCVVSDCSSPDSIAVLPCWLLPILLAAAVRSGSCHQIAVAVIALSHCSVGCSSSDSIDGSRLPYLALELLLLFSHFRGDPH